MSYCLNPDCKTPKNSDRAQVCRACGAKLLLKERYRPIAVIGQGGFGRTFLAIDEDKPSKPRCVVKQFFPTGTGTRHLKKAADLFEQEAINLEALGNHPQIPALLAHFSQEQRQYLVQEFVEGKNLAQVLQAQGALTEAQVRAVLASLLPVLEFIHAHGVIHRDIKPANIIATPGNPIMDQPGQPELLDWSELLQALARETAQGLRDWVNGPDCSAVPQGGNRFSQFVHLRLSHLPEDMAIADFHRCQQIASHFARYATLTFSQRQYLVADASRLFYEMRQKYERKGTPTEEHLVLVDFGAAKLTTGTTTKTGTAIGSPGYVAPEQSRGKAEFSSDLYSLGVTCIQLLTNTSPLDLFNSHENAWEWQRHLATPVSDPFSRLLDRLIELGINRRYPSATDALRELDRLRLPLLGSAKHLPLATAKLPPHLGHESTTPSQHPARSASLSPVAAVPQPNYPRLVNPVVLPVSNARSSPKRRAQPSWECTYRVVNPGKVYGIALSPTEPILASSSGTTIRLWDTQAKQPIAALTGHLDIVSALVVTPDGKLLISGSADKTIKFWEMPTGKRLGSVTLHTDTVLALAIAPDGKTLASSSLHDPITLVDMTTGQERDRLYGHTSRVEALAFSPDGALLASGSGDTCIKLWEVSTGKELRTLDGHTQPVVDLAFTSDSKTLISASWDGTVKLWSTRVRRQKRSLNLDAGRVNALALSADGKWLVTGSDRLQVWNLRSGKSVGTLAGHAESICAITVPPSFSPSAASLEPRFASASWDGAIQLWQPERISTPASRKLP